MRKEEVERPLFYCEIFRNARENLTFIFKSVIISVRTTKTDYVYVIYIIYMYVLRIQFREKI